MYLYVERILIIIVNLGIFKFLAYTESDAYVEFSQKSKILKVNIFQNILPWMLDRDLNMPLYDLGL